MPKPKNVRVYCTVGPKVEIYIQWLLRQGLHGESRAEVVRRLLCNGVIEALPGEAMRRLSDDADKRWKSSEPQSEKP